MFPKRHSVTSSVAWRRDGDQRDCENSFLNLDSNKNSIWISKPHLKRKDQATFKIKFRCNIKFYNNVLSNFLLLRNNFLSQPWLEPFWITSLTHCDTGAI